MLRHLYSFALTLGIPLLVLRLYLRSLRAPAYRQRIGERFSGKTAAGKRDWSKRLVWIHAVSVGEVAAAVPLVNALLKQSPHIQILVTSMTPTGSTRIYDEFADQVLHCYVPYDIPFLLVRFLHRLRPELLVIMETELWPNLVHICHSHGIKVMLANARLSEKSASGYRRFLQTTQEMLSHVDVIAAQSVSDARRFIALGALEEKITVTGSLKFNTTAQSHANSLPQPFNSIKESGRPVLVAASTREGEEGKVLIAFRSVLNTYPETLLILVPRHPERFAEVARLCADRKLLVQRRSRIDSLPANMQVLLGDSMGEMIHYYTCATLAFVGGSLVNTGCQNVLEPAALGIPVLVGPSQYNFAAICQALEQAGALQTVSDEIELGQVVVQLLGDTDKMAAMGGAGREQVAANQQALPEHLRLVNQLLQ